MKFFIKFSTMKLDVRDFLLNFYPLKTYVTSDKIWKIFALTHLAKILPQMIRILQAIAQIIAPYERSLLMAYIKYRTTEQMERDELKKLAQDEYIYTKNYCYSTSELSKDKPREYCRMQEKYFEMFLLLRRGAEECRRCEDDTRVVGLKYLRDNDSPRKWMEYVIFYSLEKRRIDIDDDEIFIGVALYSQYYNVTGIHKETLINNLFELYIKKKILNTPTRNVYISMKQALLGVNDSLHNRIYTKTGELRDKQELHLLEEVMKAVLLAVLVDYEIPFSHNSRTGNLTIHKKYLHSLEGWCSQRESVGNWEVISFSNVVMKRLPTYCLTNDQMKILLALIGMVRTGKNIIPYKCKDWLNRNFQHVIELVDTNRNLVGVTGLNSDMKIDKLLGGLKGQLKYLEIEFIMDDGGNNYGKIIEFINSLENEIDIRASFHDFLVEPTIQALLDSAKIKRIQKLRLMSSWDNVMVSHVSILGDRKIIELELYNCDMSLEEFLLNEDSWVLRSRLRVLEVTGIGSIENVTDNNLRSLKIERLCINGRDDENVKMTNLDQLMNRGIIAWRHFKYLVFKNIHSAYRQRILDLRNKLGGREWPVVLTNFEPPGTVNVDFTRICTGTHYELHPRRLAHA